MWRELLAFLARQICNRTRTSVRDAENRTRANARFVNIRFPIQYERKIHFRRDISLYGDRPAKYYPTVTFPDGDRAFP